MTRSCAASTRTLRLRAIHVCVAARCRSITGRAFRASSGVRRDGSSARIESWGGCGQGNFRNAHHKLPAAYFARFVVAAGGLISYGPDFLDMHRRPVAYVDRILKGEKPADLPVQAPTKYEL